MLLGTTSPGRPRALAPARRVVRLTGTTLRLGARALARATASPPGERREAALVAVADGWSGLGPVAVKLAQLLATRRDILPPSVCDRLEALWGQGPRSFDRGDEPVALRLAAASGQPAGTEFSLVGSGSIAYVLHATRPDGGHRAVKVVKPGVREAVDVDLALVRGVARVLQHLPAFSGIPVRAMVDHLASAIEAQTDLVAEGRSLVELGAAFADLGHVRVPRHVRTESSADTLVMEWVPAAGGVARPSEERAEDIMVLVYEMLFTHGLVHVDLHPGNLDTHGDEVVVYDAGFVMRVDHSTRRSLGLFFLGLAVGDGQACARAVVESCEQVPPDADLDGFTEAMQTVVDANTGARSGEFNVVSFSQDLFTAQRAFGLYPDASFVFPLMSLVAVEGQVRALHPGLDFQSLSIPYVGAALEAPHPDSPRKELIHG
ncbi:AarF/ABC1/UbiB kinase family protein [Phycicoccus sp. CSK15P-2]|uniref:ABC1 kinase family protein n=1 Tax=Phycicoccus sp. CSK15P-2 TaxID=2807627 RepID=UPI00194E4AFB|nr:AarF/UbiB family protein [Phycicoccus sp. CSK15P-2]MBM6405595.1 AarF/ABC1/UbiB kinase family protein [Phycicoccus sp. CSK15P-2]